MHVVDFENLNGLSQDFIKSLKSYDEIFAQLKSIEQLDDDEFHQLIMDIDDFCFENRIIGYHYTNAIKNDILGKGIIIRTGEEIRQNFIQRHFHLFTKGEQNRILFEWQKWFDEEDAQRRDSIICFDFTTGALKNGGADDLLSYYGGEQVYLPFIELPHIGEKLKNIGTPMILKCILNPSDIHTYTQYPWGKLTVSSYHKLKKPDACLLEPSAYQEIGVNPENIEIIKDDK